MPEKVQCELCEYVEVKDLPRLGIEGPIINISDKENPCYAFRHEDHLNSKKKHKSEQYKSIFFHDTSLNMTLESILFLGVHPHIHGAEHDRSSTNLSGKNVYALAAEMKNLTEEGYGQCPFRPWKVTIGASVVTNADQISAIRISVQQSVIAFNQTQHRLADTVVARIPECILPELKRIVVEYAVLVPVGQHQLDQVVPTFWLHRFYDERPLLLIERDFKADIRTLKDMFHVFEWQLIGSPQVERWTRPITTVTVLD